MIKKILWLTAFAVVLVVAFSSCSRVDFQSIEKTNLMLVYTKERIVAAAVVPVESAEKEPLQKIGTNKRTTYGVEWEPMGD